MNPALAIEQQVIGPTGFGELLTFVGLPSKRSARELSGSAEELFKGITAVLDQLLLTVIKTRTEASFITIRNEVFGKYFQIAGALSKLAHAIVPPAVIDVLVAHSFSELEAALKDQGILRFGEPATDQAIFTVWTLLKTSRLLSKIAAGGPPPKEAKEADTRLASEFSFWAAWTQFHLDCMMAAIRLDKAIHPEVLPEIVNGLRAAENAYGLIRQGIDLRTPRSEEPVFTAREWDREDQELLDSSMHDMDMAVSLRLKDLSNGRGVPTSSCHARELI